MSDQVFESDRNESEQTQQAQTEEQRQEELRMIGEGKKYKDPIEADKALFHSQEHINKIEDENKLLRDQLEELNQKVSQAKTVDDVLSRLESHKEEREVIEKPSDEKQSSSVSPDSVMELVNKALSEREQKSAMQKNMQEVRDQLSSKFGEKAAEVFKKKQEELSLDLNNLAAQSPKAVLELFQSVKEVPANSEQSSVNTSSFANSGKPQSHLEDPEWKAAVKKQDFVKAAKIADSYNR